VTPFGFDIVCLESFLIMGRIFRTQGSSGTLVAGGFILALTCTIGVAQVYLPYYSDLGKARREMGGTEEMKAEEKARREALMRKIKRERGGGSMWKNLDDKAKSNRDEK
jgi:hypothetical protein